MHTSLQTQASKAVNFTLTLRNWLIGFYIVEFEQNGDDRAQYGTALLGNIAKNISIKGLSAPELSRCRQFYMVYPEILGSETQKLLHTSTNNYWFLSANEILGMASQELKTSNDNPPIGILLVTDKNTALVEYATANEKDPLFVSKYKLSLPSKEALKIFIENELKK